jgi:CDP-diacylglycerol--glycerol-3-phosphate 3-phosphatidyltransferase
MTIANYFTFVRLIISPIFLLIYVDHQSLGITDKALPYVLLVLFGISECSDLLDGYLARKYNQVTDFGKIFDPMADSIARFSMFLSFTTKPVQLHILLVFLFFYRDAVVSTLRTVCALHGFALAARRSGKIKAVIQAIAALIVLVLMIPHSLGKLDTSTLQWISNIVVGIAGVYTIYSGCDYIYANRGHLKAVLQQKTATR